MAIGRTNTGGGNPLNYTVVGGTTQPTSPKENTIWVKSSTAITSYQIRAYQPTGAAGMVWIKYALSGYKASFNALKDKNMLQVLIASAQQYVNGAWNDVEAYIYQKSAWVQFSEIITALYLYNQGASDDSVTGGWKSTGTESNQYSSPTPPTVTQNSESVSLSIKSSGKDHWPEGVYMTNNKVSLKGYTKLNIHVLSASGNGGASIRILNSANEVVASVGLSTGNKTLDISGYSSGSYYVGISMSASSGWNTYTCEYDKIWLSK